MKLTPSIYREVEKALHGAWLELNRAADTSESDASLEHLGEALRMLVGASRTLHGDAMSHLSFGEAIALLAQTHREKLLGREDSPAALKQLAGRLERAKGSVTAAGAEGNNAPDVLLIDEAIPAVWRVVRGLQRELRRRRPRALYLRSLDTLWMNHLDEIDYLRQGIGLRGYGQRDPLIEYKREAYDLFLGLMDAVRKTYLMTILKVGPATSVPEQAAPREISFRGASEDIGQFRAPQEGETSASGAASGEAPKQEPLVNTNTVSRNDPCPCGSGKKYKKCHGK